MFVGILMLGSYHREPRAAGVFAPGLAQGNLNDIHLPRTTSFDTMMRQDTLELGASVSQESLGRTPTPKRLDMGDATGSGPPVESPNIMAPAIDSKPTALPLRLLQVQVPPRQLLQPALKNLRQSLMGPCTRMARTGSLALTLQISNLNYIFATWYVYLECIISRMQRFFSQHKKKKVQASAEVVKMWGTGPGRALSATI